MEFLSPLAQCTFAHNCTVISSEIDVQEEGKGSRVPWKFLLTNLNEKAIISRDT